MQPGTVTLIGRGAVHVFERAEDLTGAVLRFGDELLLGDGPRGARLAAGRPRRAHGARCPAGAEDALEAALRAIAAEAERPPDPYGADLLRHLVSAVLLWVERWYDAVRTERRAADDAEVQLHRRFAAVLERDFRDHHDAAHYADALAIPPAALSRALSHVTGRSTKELVTDRVMLEAARLLRFTDDSVGEVAHRAGFARPALLLARVQAPRGRGADGLPRPRAREVHASVRSCHGKARAARPMV